MHTTQLFRFIGGFSSVISGVFLGVAHLINLLGGTDTGTVLGQTLVLLAHLGLTFAFIGLFEAQGKRNGLLGNVGMVFSIVGTIFVTAVVFVEIAGASGVNVYSIFHEGVSGMIYNIGPLFFVLGMILFGISVIKEKVLPQMSGLCLLIGTIVFALASLLPTDEGFISFIGGAITGMGFVWLGSYLLSHHDEKLTKEDQQSKAL